jgi:adenylate kinase
MSAASAYLGGPLRRAPVVVVLGRQGAGKGVQCRRLSDRILAEHLSTGDLLRSVMQEGTALGRQAEPFVARGDLVPDDLMAAIVCERIAEIRDAGRGVVLDGFPRTIGQALLLCEPEAEGDPPAIDIALHIAVPRDLAVERLRVRMVCTRCGLPGAGSVCDDCGGPTAAREDDHPAAIERRLDAFDAETRPLLEWLSQRGLLTSVDGTGTPDEVAARIADVVLPLKAQGGALAG